MAMGIADDALTRSSSAHRGCCFNLPGEMKDLSYLSTIQCKPSLDAELQFPLILFSGFRIGPASSINESIDFLVSSNL